MRQALKEWSIAVSALTQAETIVLLRKGGLREQGGKFALAAADVLLYPTYEHQNPTLLKAPYGDRVKPVPPGWHPEIVEITAVAQITDVFQVTEAAIVESLLPFHIWNEQFVIERLRWQPQSPLSVLLLRVAKLTAAQTIPYQARYGGCRSWLELAVDIDPSEAQPVLSESEYLSQKAQIAAILS
jgi:hypothetical protein